MVIMHKLLNALEKGNAGVSVCNLYLGGAAHADDVHTTSTSMLLIKVTDQNIKLQDSTLPILSHAKCLGYN